MEVKKSKTTTTKTISISRKELKEKLGIDDKYKIMHISDVFRNSDIIEIELIRYHDDN